GFTMRLNSPACPRYRNSPASVCSVYRSLTPPLPPGENVHGSIAVFFARTVTIEPLSSASVRGTGATTDSAARYGPGQYSVAIHWRKRSGECYSPRDASAAS
ncbi:MAG TPA: hypothetical protein VLM40_20060, partial [Gemmata sp.]|nr:hypothetical protein [Gemmata sp.]